MRAGDLANLEAVTGTWDVTAKVLGHFRHSVLTVAAQDGVLAATLHDEVDGEMEVTAVSFGNGILSYEYKASGSQVNWGKGSVSKLRAWLQVRGETVRGALSLDTPPEGDFTVEGRRTNTRLP